MSDLVSIVIPVYKAEKTIEKCVRSLLNGAYENIEILLVEDCGGDCSLAICHKLAEEDLRVRVYENEQNKGVSYTRNIGLDNANGKYLMFLDSDDTVEPDFVRVMAESSTPGVMPVCGYCNHDEIKNGRADIFVWQNSSISTTVSVRDGLTHLREKRLLQMIWNKVFLLDIVKSHRLRFEESLPCGEDFRFLLDYIEAANIKSFCCLPDILYHYSRDNANSLATKYNELPPEELLSDLRRMYEMSGFAGAELDQVMTEAREEQLSYYAYGYMHDKTLTPRQKKGKICALDKDIGARLYHEQKLTYVKEKLKKVFTQ